MTRTPRRPSTPADRRDRTPRRGRHRLERSRRPARYAAAGLLALTGAVAVPAMLRDRPRDSVAVIQPLSSPRLVALVRASRTRKPRAARMRWATRTVEGRVLHGRATWYGPGFEGRRTASGEVFRSRLALTAAHRTLPFGTRLRVCYRGDCVVVRVNDRGPFGDAILDLSRLAADEIGLTGAGIGEVTATVLHTRRVRVRA